uniref:Activin_recp domain-containing protein n=1 Tax=Panagrellus redivivus TaxID=6233 RepID=A0A7E4ZZZ2_PANRE
MLSLVTFLAFMVLAKAEIVDEVDVDLHNGTILPCFVGVMTGMNKHRAAGAVISCSGQCANVTLNVNNYPVSVFFCDGSSVCESFNLANKCTYLYDHKMTMCCCDDSSFCNVRQALDWSYFNKTLSDPPDETPTLQCFSGVSMDESIYPPGFGDPLMHRHGDGFHRNHISGNYETCIGSCANISLNIYGTLYFCDPVQVCKILGIRDRCAKLELQSAMDGCCCSENDCNIPAMLLPHTDDPVNVTEAVTVTQSSEGPVFGVGLLFLYFVLYFSILTT